MVLFIVIVVIFALILTYILFKNASYHIKIMQKAKQVEVKKTDTVEPVKPANVKSEMVEKKDDGKVVLKQKVIENSTSHQIDNIAWNEREKAEKHLEVIRAMQESEKQEKVKNATLIEKVEEVNNEKNHKTTLESINDLTPEMKTVILADVLNQKKF